MLLYAKKKFLAYASPKVIVRTQAWGKNIVFAYVKDKNTVPEVIHDLFFSSIHKYSTIILIQVGLNVRKLNRTNDEIATRPKLRRATSLVSIWAGIRKAYTGVTPCYLLFSGLCGALKSLKLSP